MLFQAPFPAGYKAKKDYSIIKTPLAQFMTQNPLNSLGKSIRVFWGASGPVFVCLGILVGKNALKGEPYNQRGSGNMTHVARSWFTQKSEIIVRLISRWNINSTDFFSHIGVSVPLSAFHSQAAEWWALLCIRSSSIALWFEWNSRFLLLRL